MHDAAAGVLVFMRRSSAGDMVLCAYNFTPVVRPHYRVGAPAGGRWRELLNSDAAVYGGSGAGNMGGVDADDQPLHGRPHSLSLTLPPLGCVMLAHEPGPATA